MENRRRNSILKNDASPTRTMPIVASIRNKRISFSGKNSVKEFVEGQNTCTDWIASYEQATDARQVDTVSSSEAMDISMSMVNAPSIQESIKVNANVVTNKENLHPDRANRYSFALFDSECTNMDSADSTVTELHMDLIERNESYGENFANMFKVKTAQPNKSVVKVVGAKETIPARRGTIYETEAMDESLRRFGDTLFRAPDPVPSQKTNGSGAAVRETIYFNNHPLDQSTEPRSQRQTINYKQGEDALDESHVQNPKRGTIHFDNEQIIDESVAAATVPRATIHFKSDDMVVEEHSKVSQQPQKGSIKSIFDLGWDKAEEEIIQSKATVAAKTTTQRQSIYQAVDMDVTRDDNLQAQKQRQTIYFNQNADEMDLDKTGNTDVKAKGRSESVEKMVPVLERRGTIHFQAEDAALDESLVAPPQPLAGPSRPNIVTAGTHSEQRRQTVYYTTDDGALDESKENMELEKPTEIKQAGNQNRQTVYYNRDDGQMDESKMVVKPGNTRQTVYYNQNNGVMDVSNIQLKPQASRQTVYFNQDNGKIDESPVRPQKPQGSRQTIHYNPDDGQMEESMVLPKVSRQTVHYNRDNAEMDESVIVDQQKPSQPQLIPQASRQTVYFTRDEGQLDESQVLPMRPQINRQTINFNKDEGQMDVSVAMPQISRPTVYYNQGDGELDESVVGVQKPPSNNRQTIYFDQADIKVDEEPQMKPKQSQKRQTIHFSEDDGQMDESRIGQKRPSTRQTVYYGQEEDAMEQSQRVVEHLPNGHSTSVKQHREPVEEVGAGQQQQLEKNRQTVYFSRDEDQMDESRGQDVEMDRDAEVVFAVPQGLPPVLARANKQGECSKALDRSQRMFLELNSQANLIDESSLKDFASDSDIAIKPRGAIQRQMAVDESLTEKEPKPNESRRGTYVVASSQSHLRSYLANTTTEKQKEETRINLSGETIDDDSDVEVVSRYRPSSGPYKMLDGTVQWTNETLNGLNLQFNVTGQITPVDGLEADSADASPVRPISRIPVRTPDRRRVANSIYDVSGVDDCRDAAAVSMTLGRSNNARDFQPIDISYKNDKAIDGRLSIPAFNQTMDVEEDVEDEEEEQRDEIEEAEKRNKIPMRDHNESVIKTSRKSVMTREETTTTTRTTIIKQQPKKKREMVAERVPSEDCYIVESDSILVAQAKRVDVEWTKEVDWMAGHKIVRELRSQIDDCYNAPSEDNTIYETWKKGSFRQYIQNQIREKADQLLEEMRQKYDRGCFPLPLPMEETISNLLKSNHKAWRYQDLHYHVHLLKFRHRLIKTFVLCVKFREEVEDDGTEDLIFTEVDVLEEQNMECVSKVDQLMHAEFVRAMPVGLLSLYGSAADLSRMLDDFDAICKRIFAKHFKAYKPTN